MRYLLSALPAAARSLTLATTLAVSTVALGGPARADDLKTVNIFVPTNNTDWKTGYELIEVADAHGFFAKHGIKPNFTNLPWDQYTVALDSGSLDFAPFADYAYFINVFDKGLKAHEVVSSTLPFNPQLAGDGLEVLADGPIKTAADMKGKRIGTAYPSFSGVWFAMDWLTKHGVTKDDVTIVPIPQAQLQQVLDAGGIDAIIAYEPLNLQLNRSGRYRQLFSTADIAGRFVLRGGTMASDKFIAEHPDLVKGYVSAIAEAADWANDHPAEVVKLGVDRGKLDPQYLPQIYNREGKEDYSKLRWATHALNDEADIAFWLKLVEDADIVPKNKYKPSDFYTNAFNPFADQHAAK